LRRRLGLEELRYGVVVAGVELIARAPKCMGARLPGSEAALEAIETFAELFIPETFPPSDGVNGNVDLRRSTR